MTSFVETAPRTPHAPRYRLMTGQVDEKNEEGPGSETRAVPEVNRGRRASQRSSHGVPVLAVGTAFTVAIQNRAAYEPGPGLGL